MNSYHFTNSNGLESIVKEGLKPQLGKNGANVKDVPKLCFSVGEMNEIIMNAFFYIKYNYDPEFKASAEWEKFLSSQQFLLSFDSKEAINENYQKEGTILDNIDGFTLHNIERDKINICRLKNSDNKIIYDKHEIVKWLMSCISFEDIQKSSECKEILSKKPLKYLINAKPNCEKPIVDENTYKVANKTNLEYIKEFYELNEKDIKKYKNSSYVMEFEDLVHYQEKNIKTNIINQKIELYNKEENYKTKSELYQEVKNLEKAIHFIVSKEKISQVLKRDNIKNDINQNKNIIIDTKETLDYEIIR